ncbi:hypothetical protein [Streptomyces sp. 130]|uniref:hypothetical protein n=1 Tax=Streptomyces sp. 130 TaxID=2591006 RepID=UPI00163D3F84|nr:hypothetical protein [Streptomyces sp. 130]
MRRVENLFTSQEFSSTSEAIDWDPFKEDDALEDAQLLDSRVCPTANRAALLFDMRTASYYPSGNSALLVVRGLRSFHWSGMPQSQKLMAFTAVSSRPHEIANEGFRLELEFFPDGILSVSGERADFYLLEAHDLPEAPPSYPDLVLDQVRHGLPWWDSACTVLASSSASSD